MTSDSKVLQPLIDVDSKVSACMISIRLHEHSESGMEMVDARRWPVAER